MLYHLYEAQRALMAPFSEMTLAASHMYTNPMLPLVSLSPYATRMAAGYKLLHRLVKEYPKPEFDIVTAKVHGVDVSIHERVDIDKPFCRLVRFKRYADDSKTLETMLHSPPVLVVAPLSGHYSTLLRDTVKTLLNDHKVYVTDWKNARDVPLSAGRFNLDDYVNYVQEFIRHVHEMNGECHVISVCQPTVPVMAAVSLMASRGERTPASMTMMGGPIDASQSPTAVNDLAVNRSHEWFENNVIYRVPPGYAGEGRRVYPGFLQYAGFVSMNPNRHATSYYDYFKNLVRGDDESTDAHLRFYDEYNAVLDMDADYYLDTIRTVFQEFKLVNGTWDVESPEGKIERVRPQDITKTAVLAVEGELDDIAGIGQTQASLSMCSNVPEEDKQYFELKGAGHYGIFSGRKWREIVYPVVRDFIARHHVDQVSPQRHQASQELMAHLKQAEALQGTRVGLQVSDDMPMPIAEQGEKASPSAPVAAPRKPAVPRRRTTAAASAMKEEVPAVVPKEAAESATPSTEQAVTEPVAQPAVQVPESVATPAPIAEASQPAPSPAPAAETSAPSVAPTAGATSSAAAAMATPTTTVAAPAEPEHASTEPAPVTTWRYPHGEEAESSTPSASSVAAPAAPKRTPARKRK
ncbi:MAG: polyhydroxyalkanoate depolymerase [Brachymonas sp.]